MSDPIEKLTRLGDALEGAPMPLPASEIRARGDRIRRRKHAVIAGASAAVIAAVAVPVIALTVGGSDKAGNDFTETPSPSVSDPVPSAALTAENLITSEDAGPAYGGAGDWAVSSSYRGDGQDVFHQCTPSALADFGAQPVFRRDFDLDPARVPTGWMTAIAGEFRDAASARAAYDDLSAALRDCDQSVTVPKNYALDREEDVPIGVDGEAHRILATYDFSGPDIHAKAIMETGLVLSGDRIEIVTSVLGAQDYDFENPPMEAILPRAAERLVFGGGTEPSETATPTPVWPTTIPAGFPLISGWPQDDGSSEYQLDEPSADNQAMIPAGELDACGRSAVDPGAVDRLTTRLTPPAESYVRELQLFPTDQEAVTYVAHLRALYGDCPAEGSTPTITTEVMDGAVGEESLLVTRVGEEIYRTVINVVRIGNAVVVDLASDEGLAADVQDLATETRENLADVIAAMAGLQDDSGDAGSSPDPTAPAKTTTVPASFPLDLALGEPPVSDGETTVEGPGPDVPGVDPETACGVALAMPNAGSPDPEHELGYSVSTIEGYDGRTIHAYPTAQDAVDQMEQLRAQLQGCGRDSEGDGLSDRVWRSFNSDTGYDSVTFGWYYAPTESQGATAGGLYTVVRVGNAILAVSWGGEYSADYQRDAAPNQVELAKLIGAEMCVFAEAGC